MPATKATPDNRGTAAVAAATINSTAAGSGYGTNLTRSASDPMVRRLRVFTLRQSAIK